MKYASRRQKQEREILEENVGYAEGSVKEYLNIKRTSKDRCCLVFFCLYMIAIIMLAGVGFFYGNFNSIGTFVVNNTPCTQLISYSSATDTYLCNLSTCTPPSTYALLQKVCVPSSYSPSSTLSKQIDAYNLHLTLGLQLYMNIGVVVGLLLIFSLLICYPKIAYLLFFSAFALLLTLPFLLLKNSQDRTSSLLLQYASDTSLASSSFIASEKTLQPLAYLLLAIFLVLMPVGLFSIAKIRMGVSLLGGMWNYFQRNYTIVIFSMTTMLGMYAVVFVLSFLLLNFLTGGTAVSSTNSFFYFYEKISLQHPAALAFYYIGAVWLVATFSGWHQHIICSSVVQWYFQDGGKLKPVRKGMKRGWYNLGSHALSAIVFPLEWIALFLYAVAKMDGPTLEQIQQEAADHNQDCNCLKGSLLCLRQALVKLYVKMNRSSVVAQALTNNSYIESSELAAVTFSERSHRFFNVGGALTIFLTLFTSSLILLINYIPLYYQNFGVFPSKISSLSLQLLLAVSLGLGLSTLISGLLGTSVDAVLFCFLMEKKGESMSQKEIKKTLEEYFSAEEEQEQVTEMYEVDSDAD